MPLKFLFQTFFRQKKFSLQNFSYKKISKIGKRQKNTKNEKKNGREIDRTEPLRAVDRKLAVPVREASRGPGY